MFLDEGKGTNKIADILQAENVLTPMNYWVSKGLPRGGTRNENNSRWNVPTVLKILSRQEYCGDVINFKTFSKSYKNKKRIENDVENMMIFKDVHEPIIDRQTWERVQAKRSTFRKRKTQEGEKSLFSNYLVCGDCGGAMHYHFNQANPEIKYFNCRNNNVTKSRRTCDTTHYIRVDFLEQVVLGEIKKLTKFASNYENEFSRAVMGHSQKTVEAEQIKKQKELKTLRSRDKELDKIFNKIYEDNMTGKLDDLRFSKMSQAYTDEQKGIAEKIKGLELELEKASKSNVNRYFYKDSQKVYES